MNDKISSAYSFSPSGQGQYRNHKEAQQSTRRPRAIELVATHQPIDPKRQGLTFTAQEKPNGAATSPNENEKPASPARRSPRRQRGNSTCKKIPGLRPQGGARSVDFLWDARKTIA